MLAIRSLLSGGGMSSTRTKTSTLLARREFQSLTDYQQWHDQIQTSRIPDSTQSLVPLDLAEHAPFLYSVSPMADHLELAGTAAAADQQGGALHHHYHHHHHHSPRASMLQCRYPLEQDALLRNSVRDLTNWSSFRLGKFYDTVDALTADVGYRHLFEQNNHDHDDYHDHVTLVTAGHYHSRKTHRTDIHRDLFLRSYVTYVGTSSMEIRTDALQKSPDGKDDLLVNMCHTIMVALDTKSMRPLSKIPGKVIPPLQLVSPDDHARLALAEQHQDIRRQRSESAMQLRAPVSVPPGADEMRDLHRLHQAVALRNEVGKESRKDGTAVSSSDILVHAVPSPARVADFTFRSSKVIFPEKRNVHGKLFGGFVMEESQNLAQYTASFFAQGRPIIPLGIDEAIFLQPISIGDLVTFTARLVHSTVYTCRVLVTVEVRDAADRDRVPVRSNRLMFVFVGSDFGHSNVVPDRYGEMLMHIDAQRRYQVEGPSDDEVQRILEESKALAQTYNSA